MHMKTKVTWLWTWRWSWAYLKLFQSHVMSQPLPMMLYKSNRMIILYW